MELKKEMVKRAEKKGDEFSQITLDDDYIVKDSKPDVIKIIHAKGNVVIDEMRINAGAVWLNGRLEFDVLYRSDDEYNKTECLTGTIPFQEKVVVDDISEVDKPQLLVELEDLTISIINSRKLTVRSIMDVHVIVEEEKEDEIATEIMEKDRCQQKQSDKQMLSLIVAKKDILRVKKEIALSNNKANIQKILWKSVDVRNIDHNLTNGKIQLQGELYPTILYQSDEAQLEWMDTMLTFSGELDTMQKNEPDVFWVKPVLATLEAESKNDSDGESRIIVIDLCFEVYYKLWEEKEIKVLEDAYALDCELIPKREQSLIPCFRMKNVAKVRVGDTFTLSPTQDKILQICSYKGNARIEHISVTEQGICFEGVLCVHILYLTAEDNYPIAHVQEVLYFEQLVEVDQMTENTWYEYVQSVDQLQVNLLDNSEYEIKAIVRIGIIAFEEERIDKICEIEETKENMNILMERPGFVGYIAGEQEELWDVAKEYHTTMADIMETNDLKSKKLAPGSKIIIVKRITAC